MVCFLSPAETPSYQTPESYELYFESRPKKLNIPTIPFPETAPAEYKYGWYELESFYNAQFIFLWHPLTNYNYTLFLQIY